MTISPTPKLAMMKISASFPQRMELATNDSKPGEKGTMVNNVRQPMYIIITTASVSVFS